MKIFANIFISLLIMIPLSAGQFKKGKKVKKIKQPIKPEPASINRLPSVFSSPPHVYSSRETDFNAVLIDSSLNGYGAYSNAVNPLAFSLDRGQVAVYRQMHGRIPTNAITGAVECAWPDCSTAGYIGSSQCFEDCTNKDNWIRAEKLNSTYPTGVSEPNLPTAGFVGPNVNNPPLSGQPQGRYPSAGFTDAGLPYAIWNEYTDATYAGGEYGGYPLYTLDVDGSEELSDGVGEMISWQNTQIVNNSCNPVPCNPPNSDFWVGNIQLFTVPAHTFYGDPGAKFTGLYSGGLGGGGTDFFWITSSSSLYDYWILEDPYILTGNTQTVDGEYLWQQDPTGAGAYHARPDYHINKDGIGYMVFSSRVNEPSFLSGEPSLRTMFFKKTEDFGDSWNAIDGGLRDSDNGFISDQLLLHWSDSLSTMYAANPERYPQKLYYADAMCDSIDEDNGDIIEDIIPCGDTVGYQGYPPLILTDGLSFAGDYDTRTDEDGGLHIVANIEFLVCYDTLYSTSNGLLSGCADSDNNGVADSVIGWQTNSTGHFYLYNADPASDPDGWTFTELSDFDSTNNAEYLDDMAILDDILPSYYMYPEITMSAEEGSQVMWYATFMASKYIDDVVTEDLLAEDIDIFVRKSTDLGKTWTDLKNVTNTPGDFETKVPEVALHLASYATDEEVSMFFHVPNFEGPTTVSPATGMEDYVNRIYIGTYYSDEESGGTTVANDDEIQPTPKRFSLMQNYPNPFNPVTKIAFNLDKPGEVLIDLFDLRGAKIKTLLNESRKTGSHELMFDGSDLASGVYLYSMTFNGVNQTRKLVLMK